MFIAYFKKDWILHVYEDSKIASKFVKFIETTNRYYKITLESVLEYYKQVLQNNFKMHSNPYCQ